MGDSITEGTILELLKAPGDAVAQDEIIAVIETDKISVDVRSPVAGVLTSWDVAVDDTVEVGQQLVTIDGAEGAAAAAIAAAPAEAPAAAAPAPEAPTGAAAPAAAAPAAAVTGRYPGKRVPLIRFRYGKRDDVVAAAGAAAASVPLVDQLSVELKRLEYLAVTSASASMAQADMSPSYGRPPLDDAEAEAIMLGGAM